MITTDELDSEVLEAVRRGETTFLGVRLSVRANAAAELPSDLDRPVDRALQRLRKRSLLRFVKGGIGWQVVR